MCANSETKFTHTHCIFTATKIRVSILNRLVRGTHGRRITAVHHALGPHNRLDPIESQSTALQSVHSSITVNCCPKTWNPWKKKFPVLTNKTSFNAKGESNDNIPICTEKNNCEKTRRLKSQRNDYGTKSDGKNPQKWRHRTRSRIVAQKPDDKASNPEITENLLKKSGKKSPEKKRGA